jgi:hypothetical protein
MIAKWEGDGRRAVMQDLADQAESQGEHVFYVRSPRHIQPTERADRFEDPLEAALQHAGVGSVTGGRSQLGEGTTVEYCGLDVVVVERLRGLDVIRSVMQRVGCPRDAMIEEYIPDYCELPVWPDITIDPSQSGI